MTRGHEAVILLASASRSMALVTVQNNYPSLSNSIYFSHHCRCFRKHPRAGMAHSDDIFFLEILSYVQANEPTTKWQIFHEGLQTRRLLSFLADVMVMPSPKLTLRRV